jgi:hypothetical protein
MNEIFEVIKRCKEPIRTSKTASIPAPMEWYYEGGVLKSKPISGSRTASISGSINKAAVIRDFVNSKY